MVLRQDVSGQVRAEADLTRRTEEAAQAAAMLSARAARDMTSGGRGNALGRWGRRGRGGRGQEQEAGGRGGGRNHDRREVRVHAARLAPCYIVVGAKWGAGAQERGGGLVGGRDWCVLLPLGETGGERDNAA